MNMRLSGIKKIKNERKKRLATVVVRLKPQGFYRQSFSHTTTIPIKARPRVRLSLKEGSHIQVFIVFPSYKRQCSILQFLDVEKKSRSILGLST